MKRTIVLSMVIAVAVGLGVWPSYALRVRAANARPVTIAAAGSGGDARPEALATGGALLVLASILRRNVGGRVK
jgi:hypothetical protein